MQKKVNMFNKESLQRQTITPLLSILLWKTPFKTLFRFPNSNLEAMEISAKLLEYKSHFVIAIIVSLILAFFFQIAPQFMTILSYFWPLFISTALFLAAIIVFGRITPSPSDFYGDREGEGLLNYVAGRPEYHEDF